MGWSKGGCASESVVELHKNTNVPLGDLPTWDSHSGSLAQGLGPPLRIKVSPSLLWSPFQINLLIYGVTQRFTVTSATGNSRARAVQHHPPDLGSSPSVYAGRPGGMDWPRASTCLSGIYTTAGNRSTRGQFCMEYCPSGAISTPVSLLMNIGHFWSV